MGKSVNLCLVGFGNAGKEFCKMLVKKSKEIEAMTGYEVKVSAISTRSKGGIHNIDGVDLSLALKNIEEHGSFCEVNPDSVNLDTIELIKKSQAHILIELSSLAIRDGQPAITHIETAFSLNMHVITANKGPIAWDYERLKSIAEEKDLQFLYETTVMDGTPIFNLVKYTLPGCKVQSFKGILNSTTNFIIGEMEKGNCYEDAIKEAQIRGFAEADPSLDVDGWDAAAKTAALANVLMNGNLTPVDIQRRGIGDITKDDIEKALKEGKKIKLLCEGYMEDGKVVGKVSPALVNIDDMFSTIDATSSIIAICTDLMGEIIVVEKDPEIQQTAYGIYSDLLTLLKKTRTF